MTLRIYLCSVIGGKEVILPAKGVQALRSECEERGMRLLGYRDVTDTLLPHLLECATVVVKRIDSRQPTVTALICDAMELYKKQRLSQIRKEAKEINE